MPKIFLNFRNGDSEWAAEALRVVLEQRFGKDQVFLSHESIPIGEQWPEALLNNARTCDVFLALIGPKWLTIEGADGRPRIFGEDDWVRREIAAALAAGRPVTPILLGNTPRLDPAGDLPDDIRELARRQGPRLDVRQFDDNYAGLERKLMEIVPDLRPRRSGAGVDVDSELEVGGHVAGDIEIVRTGGEENVNVRARTTVHGDMKPGSSYATFRSGGRAEEARDQGKGDRG